MHSLRSVGVFVFVVGLFCSTVAVERYYSAVKSGQALASQLEGFELESVGVPMISVVTGFLGVMFLVAGAMCIAGALKKDSGKNP